MSMPVTALDERFSDPKAVATVVLEGDAVQVTDNDLLRRLAEAGTVRPPGVRIMAVRDGPQEQRRITLARLPYPLTEPAARLADALRAVATDASAPR